MLVIVNYGVGNLTSILNMHKRIGVEACVSGDKSVIAKADKLLLPGVGHFDACMKNFNASGLRSIVEERIVQDKIPTLGICVGAQMLTRGSEEGTEKGLALVMADTVRFRFPEGDVHKVPHMGWTDLNPVRLSPLWDNLPDEPRFYFAHSYHFRFDNNEVVIGSCHYGYEFPCAFQKENVYALQFHPEKSHRYGMKVLENFARCS